MPYSSTSELPKAVRDKIKDPKKRRQWMHVFNSMISEGSSESAAMAGAWSAINKAQYSNDVFTTPEEARSRSMDMGLGGEIFVSDYNEQAVYMPGASEEAYMDYYRAIAGLPVGEPEEEEAAPLDLRIEALRAIVQEVLKGNQDFVPEMSKPVSELTKTTFESRGKVTKMDDEKRIVYGYASVISKNGEPIIDRQGDIISAKELEEAASEFMLSRRVGKTMHFGEPTTTIIHSFPMTNEIKKAYQIESPYEAWLIAVKVHDDATWDMVKSGELKDFSIGGSATRRKI